MTTNAETEVDLSVLQTAGERLEEARDAYLIADTAYMDEAVRLYDQGVKVGTLAKDSPLTYATLRARIFKIIEGDAKES